MSRAQHKVAEVEELEADGDRVVAEVDGKEVAVFRIDGEYYATLNYCVHQGGPLCEGKLTGEMVVDDDGWEWLYEDEERIITCPWHGWKFDLTTGENTQDRRYVIPQYEVVVTDGDVCVVV